MKTNKSFTKRLKVTPTGKILARKGNKNHFKAKKTRAQQLNAKNLVEFKITPKQASRFMGLKSAK